MSERSDRLKAEIARAAVRALVHDGRRLGLGSRSTALEVIRRVDAEIAAGRLWLTVRKAGPVIITAT